MSDKIAIRLCVDTGFSHDCVAALWYRHLGVWAAWHAENWAEVCSQRDHNKAAKDWLLLALGDENFSPSELMDPDPEIRNGGDWLTVRIVFVPGGYKIYVELREENKLQLRQIHGSRQLRNDDVAWMDEIDRIEKGRHWPHAEIGP